MELVRAFPFSLTVTHVKAHLEWKDVLAGKISASDWTGNDRADANAKKGVTLHADYAAVVAFVETGQASYKDWAADVFVQSSSSATQLPSVDEVYCWPRRN